MVLFYLLLLLTPVSSEDENCPGWCGNPVEEIKLWTDNPHIWRCELPSVVVLPCADDAYISCRRLDDLGGDLYLMLFADSPYNIGIDPDFLAKGRIDTLRTVIECKDGKWTLPNSTIQMTHILCDQYIINKTKAEESPFKPLPFKPEVVTNNESTEVEPTSITSTSISTEMSMEDLKNLETTAHNATGSTTATETSSEISRNITATNFINIELTISSTDIPKTTRMSTSTSSTSSADIPTSIDPESTSTIFLNSTTTSQSQQPELESISGTTLKHTTLEMTTTPIPSFTISSTKPLFQPSSTIRTTSQATKETTVEEKKLNISNMTTMTSASKSVERIPTIIRQTTSAASFNPRPLEEAPVPKIAQKPIALPITSTPIQGFTTVGSASATNMLAPMPKSTATTKMKTMDASVAPGLKISSTKANSATENEEVLTTIINGTAFYSPTTLLKEQQFPEITTPKPTNASNATTSILVLLVETVLPTTTSNISTSTTTTEVTATSPQQVVSVRVPTKATESISTSATKLSETTNPSTTAFDSAIILLPPTTTEQLPTSQQSSEQTPPADIQILLQPDPYDGAIEPVVNVEKLAKPLRQSRFGDIRKERLRFRKKVVPAAGISRKTRPRKATKTRKILGRPQKRRKQVRIPGTEMKSRRRQHMERKTL